MTARTKIVASIGPSSSDKQSLNALIEQGMNVARINFSHGDHDTHGLIYDKIRAIEKKRNTHLAILADLQGPKIRLCHIDNEPLSLERGTQIKISCDENHSGTNLCVDYEGLAKDVKPGEHILIDDGTIKLRCIRVIDTHCIEAKVIHGGLLYSRKGINLPESSIHVPGLTEKDKEDARFAIRKGFDWIALSFVRCAEDIYQLREFIQSLNGDVGIIAKIEKPEAVEDIDRIIDAADGIMVARGDLGVEVEFDKVPVIQKMIVNKCIKKAKPVIIATQMLDSMIKNYRPTRAEVNDVANSVMDIADALMLSGETAVGDYPVESVENMRRIISHTEDYGVQFIRNHPPKEIRENFIPDSLCYNASKMAQQSNARAIIPFTYSGYTAYRISSHRPKSAIYAFTYNENLLKRLPLLWGVTTFQFPIFESIDKAIAYSLEVLKKHKLVEIGDVVVYVGSTPLSERNSTNMIKLSIVS